MTFKKDERVFLRTVNYARIEGNVVSILKTRKETLYRVEWDGGLTMHYTDKSLGRAEIEVNEE